MSTAPANVFLHIGLHKTGTTYLQSLFRANRANLRARQIAFPGGPDEPAQGFAVVDLRGRQPRGAHDPRIGGSWAALTDWVADCGVPAVLISDERLSLFSLRQVGRAVDSFPDSQVHVIVTARDLARVAVSAWQEEIKNDTTYTWGEFAAAIRDPARASTAPARGFWQRQDLAAVCSTWESAVPPERLHVVTVPRPGSPPNLLLERFASVLGFDPTALTEEPRWNNETIGAAATEVVRRVNERLGGRLNQREYDKVVKLTVVRMFARRAETRRSTLPAEELGWATARAEQMCTTLRARGYPVVGDLDELLPQASSSAQPIGDATDDELLAASLDALACVAEEFATAAWTRTSYDPEHGKAQSSLATVTSALLRPVHHLKNRAGARRVGPSVAASQQPTKEPS